MHDIEHCVPMRIEVCVDCVAALSEGEVIDGHGSNVVAEQGVKISETWGDVQISLGAPVDAEHPVGDEPFFGDRPCQGCGFPFGGSRFAATAWTPSPFLGSNPDLAVGAVPTPRRPAADGAVLPGPRAAEDAPGQPAAPLA